MDLGHLCGPCCDSLLGCVLLAGNVSSELGLPGGGEASKAGLACGADINDCGSQDTNLISQFNRSLIVLLLFTNMLFNLIFAFFKFSSPLIK